MIERDDVGTTPRKRLTPAQRLKLFELNKGICCVCGLKIVGTFREGKFVGGKFIDEHDRPLALGGGNEWKNRKVAHPKCAAIKTREQDMPAIAKAKRQKRAQHGIKAPAKKLEGRGFPKRARETASRLPQARGLTPLMRQLGMTEKDLK